MFHEASQSDKALFNRLCPKDKRQTPFRRGMQGRLKKLGITETTGLLTEEQQAKFAALILTRHRHLAPGVDVNDRMLRGITVDRCSGKL